MALVVADRVQEVTTTSGTGTLTLTGAVSGFQTFSTAIGNGNTTFYTIFDNTAYVWEVGIGTVGAGTLARTTVLSNSSGTTTPITLAGNSAFVFCTYPAEKSINYDANGVATIGDVLGYSDTGIVGSFASTVAGYNQVIVQNKSSATNASSNLNVSNDAGTAGSNYAELGINSSTFTGSGSFNIAGASYVASASTDLTLGTYGAYSIHFVTNSNTTDAMTIYNNGGVSLGTFGNPGINNIAASKFVPGYSAVTSAAGTTVLTADSNYYQNLLGSTTQTFRLPDATTLLEGTTFIFDNDSSGTLTVVDNASGPIETVPGGAASFVYLADNATVAGTWRRHAFLPASYDFNATTANFGTATITNATWNGTTIATGYGGTGLTTFTAANNALYSTGASTLTAGTLPIAAGGTAKTTFTANGVVYGNGTSALGVTAVGTTGQVLVGNTGAAPSWGTISSSLVSSFSAGTTGLTPNTATTGAVTLGGTLDVDNGGTGQTTYTNGQLLIGNTTGNTLTKATLTGTASQVDVTNGTGSITLSLPSTINVNTSGSAATLTTSRDIYGNAFNGSANVTGIIASSFGGTGNGFTKFSGPTTSEKTFTLPNASATILTDNAAVTPAQGGTGQTTYTNGQLLIGNTTGNTLTKATLTQGTGITITNGTGSITIANASPMTYPGAGIPNSTGSAWGTSYSTSGSGTVVALTTSPSFTTPILGTPTSGTLTNCTGYTYANLSGTVPTWNQNTTGTASNVTGTVAIANGGTGQTTASAAFNALSPLTTQGDTLYGGASGAGTRLAIGTAGQVLTVNSGATAPQWSTPTTGTVTAVSVASANGFAGTSSGGATPALTLTTSITGVLKGNGTALSAATSGTDYSAGTSALATGILKSTTTTGALSIAVAADFPTLNQNTTGSAATLTTARAIYGNNFDGSAALTQVIASTYGGTGNGFTKFSGPATAEKTFTLPNATATILTDNAAVTATQGGTGQSTYAVGDLLQGGATNTLTKLAAVATGNALISGGVTTASSWGKIGLTTHVSGTLPTANGGTNLTSFTSGGAVYATSTSVLTTGTLPVASGGTGLSSTPTNGQLDIGNGTGFTRAALTQGTGITITNGTGSITVANAGVTTITGTANQITASASTGAITLSTPQSIGTASSVQFGSFGVGTAASGTTGEIRATNNVTAYYSDARLKDFKGTIPNALAKVQLLNGYYFTENARAKELGYNNDKMQVGVSAQEVEAVMPEVVTDAPINANFEGADYKTVYYDKLVPLLIEAIKELKAEVDELKGK